MKKIKPEKEWDITIKATVIKTVRVVAKNEEEAQEEAHDMFSVLNEDNKEKYEQDIIGMVEVK